MITDFNLLKLLHALTFKMTLKAEKRHFQNMQVTVHKVSNTETALSLSRIYISALHMSFPFIREVLINYDHVISQKKPQPAEQLVLGEFHHKDGE